LVVYRTYRDKFKDELARLNERREKFLELVETTAQQIPQ